jgi:hypothetical protein
MPVTLRAPSTTSSTRWPPDGRTPVAGAGDRPLARRSCAAAWQEARKPPETIAHYNRLVGKEVSAAYAAGGFTTISKEKTVTASLSRCCT